MLSLKAGGTGLNLTAASHVIHFDRWWNPAVENQATDRAFRIGQKRNVLVHKFVCRGTVEERIDALIEQKKGLAAELLEAGGEGLVTEMSDADVLRIVVARPPQRARRGAERSCPWPGTGTNGAPYVPVAERRANAAREIARLREEGRARSRP